VNGYQGPWSLWRAENVTWESRRRNKGAVSWEPSSLCKDTQHVKDSGIVISRKDAKHAKGRRNRDTELRRVAGRGGVTLGWSVCKQEWGSHG